MKIENTCRNKVFLTEELVSHLTNDNLFFVAHEQGEISFSFNVQRQDILQPRLLRNRNNLWHIFKRNIKTFDLLDQFIDTERQYLKIHQIITENKFNF